MNPEQIPLEFGVRTPQDERSEAEAAPTRPLCPCGCGKPVAVKDGKQLKWAGCTCRQKAWHAKHTTLDLSTLSEAQRVRAERMVAEALRAAKLGQRRATVDADHEVSHEAAAEIPDKRSSNRVRLDDDTWDDLHFLSTFLGLDSRSAVVKELVRNATQRAISVAGGAEG